MHPVANVGLSGSAAEALTTILVYLMGLAHLTVPDNVQSALTVLLMIGSGYLIHASTRPAAVAAPVTTPAAPAA